MSKVGVHRGGIEIVHLEQRLRVEACCVADVPSLGVRYYRYVRRHPTQRLKQRLHPADAKRLEERQVRLVGADQVAGGVDDLLDEGGHRRAPEESRIGIEADAEEALVAFARLDELLAEGHARVAHLLCLRII